MSCLQWECHHENPQEYAEVVIDGHMWLSLASVKFHVWIHKNGALKIDVDSLDRDGYTFGMIYSTIELDAMDSALQHGLQLTKATILKLNIPGIGHLEDWLLPTHVVKPVHYADALTNGVQTMAYNHYHVWRKEQDKLHHVSHHSTLWSGASSEVGSF
ncbi:hypothetical protein SCLCIDRAFT_30206 [Scleroderma citrinum Foug A]|uniref:Uncharacterized protein n=1 Tax=Scleroderma citrinum Foug A TaxID=1036808 RepID=A0A0C3DH58_9AGAM|nr:hypothetical protein SCLCIDRAFT_30206 [Scleroderma citrinum Foug A]